MNRIKVLDDITISKIAAGEVIERPSSIVKELIENSIDAGATSIAIEIKDGGKKYIRVSDDGSGMSEEEAKTCVLRHSTSKITSADDLFSISTLGFRGEAIASIASVSKFELITKDERSSSAATIVIEGGRVLKSASTGAPKGTSITVEELFYNTPARLKFQKSKSTELSHIVDIVSRYALARPDISFTLKSDSSDVLSSVGSGKLIDAIACVYGSDMAKAMVEIKSNDSSGNKIKVSGFTSQPVVTKSDRYGENIFVNGRYVRNMLISKAIEEAYRSLIPSNKFPIAVISINIDPTDIDVNVHPTKREVKFARADMAMAAVNGSVRKALDSIGVKTTDAPAASSWKISYDLANPEALRIMEDLPAYDAPGGASGSTIRPLFQLALTYIIASDGDDLVLIDQHAAHERILYERFKNAPSGESQDMLVPVSVELSPAEYTAVISSASELSVLGFTIEPFGKNTVVVRSIPSSMTGSNINEAVIDLIPELATNFKGKAVEEKRDDAFKMMACKAAVKAGDMLSYTEMAELTKELSKTSNPTTCPHGRPCIVKLPKDKLEKMFGR